MRDRLYYARKHLKDKTTSDIGFGRISDNKIYIAESLTSKNKELFKKCLDARRSLNYKFIWTSQGRIYLRKNSDTPAKLITAVQDIDCLT
jgi:flavorubredoxin